MTKALARIKNPQEKAREKTSLLMGALEHLKTQGKELNLEEYARTFLVNTSKTYSLRQDKPSDVSLAKAIVLVTINLGLSIAGAGEASAAANLLQKNPLQAFYAIGTKSLEKVAPEAKAVLAMNAFYIKRDGKRSTIELLSLGERNIVERYAKDGAIAADGLPPSTKEELEGIVGELKEMKLQLQVAKKVNWQAVLGDNTSAEFVIAYFARRKANEPATNGGIWKQFLSSLSVNASIPSAWLKESHLSPSNMLDQELYEVRKRILVRADDLRKFVETVMFDSEEIERTSASIAFKIAQTMAGRHGARYIFKKPATDSEIGRMIAGLATLFQELAKDTASFYMSVEDTQEISTEDLERFWSTKLLLKSTRAADQRLASIDISKFKPWKRIGDAKTMKDLELLVRSYSEWPESGRFNLLESEVITGLMEKDPDSSDVKAFYEIVRHINSAETKSEKRAEDVVDFRRMSVRFVEMFVNTHIREESMSREGFIYFMRRFVRANPSANILKCVRRASGFKEILPEFFNGKSFSEVKSMLKAATQLDGGSLREIYISLPPDYRPVIMSSSVTVSVVLSALCYVGEEEKVLLVQNAGELLRKGELQVGEIRLKWVGTAGSPGLLSEFSSRYKDRNWGNLLGVKIHRT